MQLLPVLVGKKEIVPLCQKVSFSTTAETVDTRPKTQPEIYKTQHLPLNNKTDFMIYGAWAAAVKVQGSTMICVSIIYDIIMVGCKGKVKYECQSMFCFFFLNN